MRKPLSDIALDLVQILLLANASIWLVFGTITSVNMVVNSTLMFVNAAVLLVLSYIVYRKKRWAFTLTGLYLVINIILTVTDQFGYFDAVLLILYIVTLLLLMFGRKAMTL